MSSSSCASRSESEFQTVTRPKQPLHLTYTGIKFDREESSKNARKDRAESAAESVVGEKNTVRF